MIWVELHKGKWDIQAESAGWRAATMLVVSRGGGWPPLAVGIAGTSALVKTVWRLRQQRWPIGRERRRG